MEDTASLQLSLQDGWGLPEAQSRDSIPEAQDMGQ